MGNVFEIENCIPKRFYETLEKIICFIRKKMELLKKTAKKNLTSSNNASCAASLSNGLVTINNLSEFVPAGIYLEIKNGNEKVFAVTKVAGKIIWIKYIWPDLFHGQENFLKLTDEILIDYFFFKGKILKKENVAHGREKVCGLSQAMKTLIEVWAVLKNPKILETKKNYDPLGKLNIFNLCEKYWLKNFLPYQVYRLRHEFVWKILKEMYFNNFDIGIKKIYQEFGILKVDYISPILNELQSQIKRMLFVKPKIKLLTWLISQQEPE